MIIYNVTVKIEKSLEPDWLDWMKTVHIPDLINTNCFESHQLCRILHDDNDGGVTYAVKYYCKDLATLQRYQKVYAKDLQKAHAERYKNRYVAFRTLMEVVE